MKEWNKRTTHITVGVIFMLLISYGLLSIDNLLTNKTVGTTEGSQNFQNNIMDSLFTASAEETYEESAQKEELKVGYILQKENLLRDQMSAQAYLVGDLDTGEVIIEKNPFDIYPIASISKYITAITSVELLEQGDTTTITEETVATEGNRSGLHTGDQIKVGSLLYPLLLVSSNDAAEALASHKNRDLFVTHMKSKVEFYGLLHTNFADPSGLSPDNYSTARDLFKLMRAIRDNHPEIVEISRLRSFEIDGYKWVNINKAQDFLGFQGGKTGYTHAAKQTSVSYYTIKTANEQVKNIGIIILQSDEREADTKKVLDYIDRYVSYINI